MATNHWVRSSYDGSLCLDLDHMLELEVKYDRDHPHQWFRWTAESGGRYLARREAQKRYPDEERAQAAAERWARRTLRRALHLLGEA